MDQSHSNKSISRSLLGTILEDSVFEGLVDSSELSLTLVDDIPLTESEASTISQNRTLVAIPETPPSVLRKRIKMESEKNEELNNELKELSEYTKLERQVFWAEMNFPLIKENRELTNIINSLNDCITKARDSISVNDKDLLYVKEIIETQLLNPDLPSEQRDTTTGVIPSELAQRVQNIVRTNSRVVELLKKADLPEPCQPPDLSEVDKQLNALKALNREKDQRLTLLNAELLDKVEQINTLSGKLEETRSSLDSLNETKLALSNEIEHLRSELYRVQRVDNLSLLDKIANLEMEKMSLVEESQVMQEELEDFKRVVAESVSSAYFENFEIATQLLPKFVDDFKMVTGQLTLDSFKLSPFLIGVTELINDIVGTLHPGYDPSETVSVTFDVIEKYESELSEKSLKEAAMKTAFEAVVKEVGNFVPALNSLEDDVTSKVNCMEETLMNLDGQVKELFLKNKESFKLALNRREERIKALEEKLATAKLQVESNYRIIETDLNYFRTLTMNDSLDHKDAESTSDGTPREEIDALKTSLVNQFSKIKCELKKAKESLNEAEEEKSRCELRLLNEIDFLKNEIDSLQNRYDPNATTLLSLDVSGIKEDSDNELREMKLALRQASLEVAEIVKEKEELIEKLSTELIAVRNAYDPNCTGIMTMDVSGMNADTVKIEKVVTSESEEARVLLEATVRQLNGGDIAALQLKADLTKEEMSALRIEYESLLKSHEELKSLCEAGKDAHDLGQIAKDLEDWKSDFIPVREQITELQSKIGEVCDENDCLRQQLESLEEKKSSSARELENLNGELTQLKERLQVQNEENAILREELKNAEREHVSSEQISEAHGSMVTDQKVTELTCQLELMKDRLEELTARNKEMESAEKLYKDSKESELAVALAELENLRGCREEAKRYSDQMKTLENRIADLSSQIAEAEALKLSKESELSAAIAQLENICTSRESRETQIVSLVDKIKFAEEHISSLTKRYENLLSYSEKLESSESQLLDAISQLESYKASAQSKQAEIDRLNEELESCEHRITSLTRLMDGAESLVASKEVELSTALAQLEKFTSCEESKEAEVLYLRDKLKCTEDRVTSLTSQNEALILCSEKLAESESELAKVHLELESCKISEESKQANIDRLNEELKSSQDRINSLTTQIDEANAFVESKEKELSAALAERENYNTFVQMVDEETTNLAIKLKYAEDRISSLTSQYENLLSYSEKLEASESELAVVQAKLESYQISDASNQVEVSRLNEELKLCEERINALTTQIDEAKTVAASKDAELSVALSQLDKFRNSKESKEAEIKNLADKLKLAETDIASLTSKYENLLTDFEKLEASESELVTLRTKLESYQRSDESKQAEINRLNEELKSREEGLTALMSQHDDAKTLFSCKETELVEALLRLEKLSDSEMANQAEISRLTEELKSAENQIEKLNSTVTAIKALNEKQISTALAELETYRASEETKQAEITRLCEQVLFLEDRITSLSQELETLKSSEQIKENEIQELTEKVKTLVNHNACLSSQKDELMLAVGTLKASKESDLRNAFDELEKYKDSAHNLDAEMAELKQETDNLRACLAQAQSRFEELESKLLESQSLNASLNQELDKVAKESEALKHSAEQQRNEIVRLTYESNLVQTQCTSMRSKHESLLMNHESLQQDLAAKEEQLARTSEKLIQVTRSFEQLQAEMTSLADINEERQCLLKRLEEVEKEKNSALENLSTFQIQLKNESAELKNMKSELEELRRINEESFKSIEELEKFKESSSELRIQVTTLRAELNLLEIERCDLKCQLEMNSHDRKTLSSENASKKQELSKVKKDLESRGNEVKSLEAALSDVQNQVASLTAQLDEKTNELVYLKQAFALYKDQTVTDVDAFLEKSVCLGNLNCGNQTVMNIEDSDPLRETLLGNGDDGEESTPSSAFGTPTASRFPDGEGLSNAVARRLRLSADPVSSPSDHASDELESGIVKILDKWNSLNRGQGDETDDEPLSAKKALGRLGDAMEDVIELKRFLIEKRPSSSGNQSVKAAVENLFNECVSLATDNDKLKTVLSQNRDELSRLSASLAKLKTELGQLKDESSSHVSPLRESFEQLRSFMKDIAGKAQDVEDLRESLSFCQNEYIKLESSHNELIKSSRELAAQYEDRERSMNSLIEKNNSLSELESKLLASEADCEKYRVNVIELEEKLTIAQQSSTDLSDALGRMSVAINSLIVGFNGQPIDLSSLSAENDVDVLLSVKERIEGYNRDLLSALTRLNYNSNEGTAWQFLSRLPITKGSSDERIQLLESQLTESTDFKVKFVRELISLEPSLSESELMRFTPENLMKQMLGVIMEKEAAVIENIQLEAQKVQQSLKSQLSDMEKEVQWRQKKLESSESSQEELSKKVDRLEEEILALKRSKGSMNETYTVCSREETALTEKVACMTDALAQKSQECEDLQKSLKKLEEQLNNERDKLAEAIGESTNCENMLKVKITELETQVTLLEKDRAKLINDIEEKEAIIEKTKIDKSENEQSLLSLQKLMKELEVTCTDMKQSLEDKCREIAELRTLAAQYEKSSTNYEETLAAKDAEMNRINECLSKRDEEIKALQTRLTESESVVATLQSEVRDLQKTNNRLLEEVASLERSIEEQKRDVASTLDTSAQIDLPSVEVKRMNDLVASLESRCEKLEAEKQDLQGYKQQCHSLQAKLLAEDGRFTVIKKNLQEDLHYKSLKITELNNKLDECAKAHDHEMQAFKLKISDLEREIQVLKSKEKRFEEQLFSQRTLHVKEKAALDEQITKSAQVLRAQREELVQFLNHVSEASGIKVVSIESACSVVAQLKEDLEEEKNKNVNLDEECDELKNQIDGLSAKEVEYFERIEALEGEINRLRAELDSNKESLAAYASSVVALKQKLVEYKGQLAASRQLSADSENLVATLKAERMKNSELTLSLREMGEQLEESRTKLRDTRDELKHARNSMEDLQAAKAALYDEFCTLQSQLEAVKKQLATIRGETESEINNLKHKASLKDQRIEALEADVVEIQSLRSKLLELNKQVKDTKVLQENRVVDVRVRPSTENCESSEVAELQKKIEKLTSDRTILKRLCHRRKDQITFYENTMRDRNIPIPQFHHENA